LLSGTDQVGALCIAAKALALTALYPGFYRSGFLGNAPLATVMVEIVLYGLWAAAADRSGPHPQGAADRALPRRGV